MHMDMELTPRLQDIIEILKVKGEVNVQDLALQLKVSPKTAKGYVRELERLGYASMDESGNIKLALDNSNQIEKNS